MHPQRATYPSWAVTLKEGKEHPFIDANVNNLSNPDAIPVIYVLYHWLLKKENDKWFVMTSINSRPPTEDIQIEIVSQEDELRISTIWPRISTFRGRLASRTSPTFSARGRITNAKNKFHNRAFFIPTKSANKYPLRSTTERCAKCGNKAFWLAFCYYSGKSTKHRIIPLCMDCTIEGQNIEKNRVRQCRICHGSFPDLHILTIEERFHLQIHSKCIPSLNDLPERKFPTWEELKFNVIIKEEANVVK